MENKINKKVENYLEYYRECIKQKIVELDLDKEKHTTLLDTIYNFKNLQLDKEDFMKRKRVVTQVNLNDRCCAKKANGDQCTRKKKDNCRYCGTHEKCQPHGIVNKTETDTITVKRCIHILDINGINYYVDDLNNVYNTADILKNSNQPKIIGKLIVHGERKDIILQ